MNVAQKDLKFALITPSYTGDFERCKLLVESVERCLIDDTKHYVVVDRRDVALFKQFTSSKVEILVVEELLPPWIFRVPGLGGWWMSLRTLPIRNWILQQLVKLSVCDFLNEEVLVFCDSDNTFIRPFDMKSRLIQDGRLALLRVDFENADVRAWIEASKTILGIEDRIVPLATYVSNMISWHRDNVIKMRQRIEEVNQIHWIRAICQYRNISEYMIYGVFVEHRLGIEAANHFLFDTELIKPSWSDPLDSEDKIRDFFDRLEESHVGVMIHSKHDIPIDMYCDRIKAFWP